MFFDQQESCMTVDLFFCLFSFSVLRCETSLALLPVVLSLTLSCSVEDIQKTMMVACKLRPGTLPTGTSFTESRSIDPLEFLKYGDLQHILQNPSEYGLPSCEHLVKLPHDNHVATSLQTLFTYGIQCLLNYCEHNQTNETTIFPLIFDFQQFWKNKGVYFAVVHSQLRHDYGHIPLILGKASSGVHVHFQPKIDAILKE